jgi:2-keto-4-pentenoate hydratase/2-oxohepta-3-ene-1,7-dioic acid hydratase in catechol pathway
VSGKAVTCVTGPFDPIELPAVSPEVIYENELAVVIGTRCRNVPVHDAAHVIAGYTICNDVTVVDWTQHSPTVWLGKSFDTHGPLGPWLVTADEVGDPQSLGMRVLVNGEERSRDHTSSMVRTCAELVSYLSQVMTLEPGDVLATGTASLPASFLRSGDVVRCEIERIGAIENPVVAQAPTR